MLIENKKSPGPVFIWAVLSALTILSWWLGHGTDLFRPEMITMIILIVAFIKIRLVILHFMEIKHASLGLRLIFETWCISVCSVLVFILVYN